MIAPGKINRIDKCIPKMSSWSPLLHVYYFLLHAPFLFEKFLLLAPGLLFSCSLLLFHFWLCSLLLSVSEGMLLAPGLPIKGVQQCTSLILESLLTGIGIEIKHLENSWNQKLPTKYLIPILIPVKSGIILESIPIPESASCITASYTLASYWFNNLCFSVSWVYHHLTMSQ